MKHFKLLMLLALALLLPIASHANVPDDYDFSETCYLQNTNYFGQTLNNATVYYKITGNETCKVVGAESNGGYYDYNKSYGVELPNSVCDYYNTYGYYTVTEIADEAFLNDENVKVVILPYTVTKIGNDAFSGTSYMTYFLGSENLESIGDNAFQGTNIQKFVLLKNSQIGKDAFKNFDSSFVVCPTFTKGAILAQTKCPYTAWVTFEGTTTYEDGMIYGTTGGVKTSVIYAAGGPTTYTIPSTVTEIGPNAFAMSSSISSVTIPSSVKKIGREAFGFAQGLFQINMPSTEIEVAPMAFARSMVTSLDLSHVKLPLPDSVCMETYQLQSVTLPAGIKEIPTSAFEYSMALQNVVLPEGLTTLKDRAFYYAQQANLTIPASVTEIGTDALSNVSIAYLAVTDRDFNLDFSSNTIAHLDFKSNQAILTNKGYFKGTEVAELTLPTDATVLPEVTVTGMSSFTVPTNVTEIPASFFYDCSSLKTVKLSSKLTKIGDYAFYNTGLTSLTIPASVKEIGANAFYSSDISSLIVEPGLTTMGEKAFQNCTNLTTVSLPSTLTSIPYYAFYNCSKLANVSLAEGLTSIGQYAFGTCSKIASITVPEGVTSIGASAFSGCTSLTYIKLPTTLTTIGSSIFQSTGLKNVVIPPNVTKPTGTSSSLNPLYSISSLKMLLPSTWSSMSSEFTNAIFYDGNEMPEKADDGLYYLNNRTKLVMAPVALSGAFTIPSTVTEIGESAFKGCYSLTSVTIPSGIKNVPNNAFRACTKLTEVKIPTSVTTINDYAFYGCSALTTADLPNGLTRIGSKAFTDCAKLTNVVLPETLTALGSYAFYGCKAITKINFPKAIRGDSARLSLPGYWPQGLGG